MLQTKSGRHEKLGRICTSRVAGLSVWASPGILSFRRATTQTSHALAGLWVVCVPVSYIVSGWWVKIYGLYGLKHHILDMTGDVTDAGQRTTTREERAIQLLICERLNLTNSRST